MSYKYVSVCIEYFGITYITYVPNINGTYIGIARGQGALAFPNFLE